MSITKSLTPELAAELRPLIVEEDYSLAQLRCYLRTRHQLEIAHGTTVNWRRRILSGEAFGARLTNADIEEQAAQDRLIAEAAKAALAAEQAKDAFLDVEALEERRRLYASRADEVWESIPASRKRSISLYIRLEELHLRALSLKLKIATLNPDTDQLSDVDQILNDKIAKLSARCESPSDESSDPGEGS
ncbi:hypothetical protein WME99_23400 [Sorangium sp. So ce136]|uniref:hypothetical protein n=1 Tax=Sorangium sp. So ce136 TaxID=3133284 RepID=UPI003EFD7DDA